ncbi:MAG: hypothetical protein LBD57_06505 [Endomicrobium sp.]|nr:hypothetical protein [Endomicrobium sp.]
MSFYLNNSSKNLLLINGIPSYITKHHPLVRFCSENKINLFIPRYYGSFESDGEFSLRNCISTVEETVTFVCSQRSLELFGQKELAWTSSEIFVLGFSFGALPVLNAKLPINVKKILCSPLIDLELNDKCKGSAKKEIYYIEKAYPNLFRFNASTLIEEYSGISNPEKEEFSLIYGDQDDTISTLEIEHIQSKYSPRSVCFHGGHTLDLNSLRQIMSIGI